MAAARRFQHVLVRAVQERRRLLRFLISRLLWRTGLGERLGLRVTLTDGTRLRFSSSALAAMLWLDPSYGAPERALVARLVPEGGCMVDVGANIGIMSLAGARAAGQQGTIVSVEPHPVSFQRLRANMSDVRQGRFVLEAVAVGERAGHATITDLVTDEQNHLSFESGRRGVRVTTLDDLLDARGVDQVDLLKIDVEGFEEAVLRGAQKTLTRTQHVLLECSTKLAARHGLDPDRALEALERAGFTLLAIPSLSALPRPWTEARPTDVLATRESPELIRMLLEVGAPKPTGEPATAG